VIVHGWYQCFEFPLALLIWQKEGHSASKISASVIPVDSLLGNPEWLQNRRSVKGSSRKGICTEGGGG